MKLNPSIIAEYEDTLIERRKSLSPYYFSLSKSENTKLALQIMKFAFEKYLRWTPVELRDCLTLERLELLKVKHLIKYIDFPPELDPKIDLFYIVWCLYPETIHFSKHDLIIRVYQNLLDRKILKFPKEFFTGSYGITRAKVCLRYMIEQFIQFKNVEEMYVCFSSTKCLKLLRKYKLLATSRDLFESHLEYLHRSLPETQRNLLFFQFYNFKMKFCNTNKPGELFDDGTGLA